MPAPSPERILRNHSEIEGEAPCFVSVYSFPRGHTSESGENIPCIDTLMFDLDFEGGAGSSTEGWARDMSALLVRTRMISKALIEAGMDKYWRASLSGHKGVHLYLDFPALDHREGTEAQFRNGFRNYTNDLIDVLIEETGLNSLDEYIDVSSGKDLARLTRLPNTIHESATERFGETRFCVPVSIKELAEIKPADYIALTRRPRPLPDDCKRVPNQRVHDILVQEVRVASDSTNRRRYSSGTRDDSRIEEYEEQANDAVTLDRAKLLLSRKPCIWAFRESGEMFKKGAESHIMELNCMAALMNLNAPIETIVDFFNTDDRFSEDETRNKVEDIIAYNYSEFDCETILEDAPSFCLKEGCNIYNRSEDLQDIR